MEIQVGKYTLCSDQWCMWIDETYTYEGKKGRNKGKQVTEKRRVAGYSNNFRQLLVSFLEHKTRSSDAKEMKEMVEDLSRIESDIRKLIEEGVK